jgi:hypothetical protein
MDNAFTNWTEFFRPMHIILEPVEKKGGLYLGDYKAAKDY